MLLTLEFYETHPDLQPPILSSMSITQGFLFFNSVGFFLTQCEKNVHPNLEGRYRAKLDQLTKAIVKNEYPGISRDALGSEIGLAIVSIAAGGSPLVVGY